MKQVIVEDIFANVNAQSPKKRKANMNQEYLEYYTAKYKEVRHLFPDKNHNDVTKLVSQQWQQHKEQLKKEMKQQSLKLLEENSNAVNQTTKQAVKNNKFKNLIDRIANAKIVFVREKEISFTIDGSQIIDVVEKNPDKSVFLIEIDSESVLRQVDIDRQFEKFVFQGLQKIPNPKSPSTIVKQEFREGEANHPDMLPSEQLDESQISFTGLPMILIVQQ